MSGDLPYEVVVGLEVHVELKTRSKIFCGCPTEFGAEPNTQVCPVCLGLPGVLPVLNRRALEQAVRAALALNCEINRRTVFDRKNYHYPDLPKGYQISQYAVPIGERGWLAIGHGEGERRIRIRRVHLEEDTGKLVHDPLSGASLVDFNRAGVPLLEIVSEADLRSPEEAREYLTKLRAVMAYADVSDVRMEEGSLRVDCNVSVRPRGSDRLGTKVEVKNLNSFRSVVRALAYEAERQWQVLQRGGAVEQETRHWDERRGVTFPSRSKEEAHDYRYFPEPDLVPVVLDEAWLERLRASLPELPDQRRARYVAELQLPEYDAAVLTAERALADYFERTLAAYAGTGPGRAARAKTVANWVMGEVLGAAHERGLEIERFPVGPERLAELLRLADEGVVSGRLAKEVFAEMLDRGESAAAVVERRGLRLIRDEEQLTAVIERVVSENPAAVADFLGGKEKAIGRLVGEVMRHTRGQADPQLVQRLLRERLAGRASPDPERSGA